MTKVVRNDAMELKFPRSATLKNTFFIISCKRQKVDRFARMTDCGKIHLA